MKKPKYQHEISIKVKESGSDNVARSGRIRASSTNCARVAAENCATKCLGRPPDELKCYARGAAGYSIYSHWSAFWK